MKKCLSQALMPCPPLAHASPIERLDLQRHLGAWHEIAKYPNQFRAQCVSDTTATYARSNDGRIEVIKRCPKASGKLEEARGVARRVGEPGSPELKVRFAPAWLSWLPMVWGDDWVIDLDEDSALVAISEPSRNYLWILAREAHVASERVEARISRLAQRRFDAARIVRSPHDTP